MKTQKSNTLQGNRLKECRLERHLTQEQLAEAANLSKQHISYVECGKRSLSLDTVRSIAKILKVRESYLLCEDEFKTDSDQYIKEVHDDNHITKCLFNLLEALGYSVKKKAATYKDIDTGELIDLEDLSEPPCKYVGETNGIIVFDYEGKTNCLSEKDFINYMQPTSKLVKAVGSLSFPDGHHIDIDYSELDKVLDLILDFIDFSLERIPPEE